MHGVLQFIPCNRATAFSGLFAPDKVLAGPGAAAAAGTADFAIRIAANPRRERVVKRRY